MIANEYRTYALLRRVSQNKVAISRLYSRKIYYVPLYNSSSIFAETVLIRIIVNCLIPDDGEIMLKYVP